MATEDDRWAALCSEYERERIGTGWLELVFKVCSAIAPRYRPDVYNDGLAWDQASFYDLAQDVIVGRLLGEGQIDYIVASASTLSGARGLVGKHVKQVLAQRVIPNQRDNVASRLYRLFEQRGEPIQSVDGVGFIPPGSSWSPVEPTDQASASAVRIVRDLPRLPNRGTDRLSPLFTSEVLESVVEPLWNVLNVPVTLNLLGRILESAFTGIAPTLFEHEEEIEQFKSLGLSTEEMVLTDELAMGLVTLLTAEQRHILVNAGVMTGEELAAVLGVSRPTALKRRDETRGVIARYFGQPGMDDLPDHLQDVVVLKALDLLGGHSG
ncbi:hypothetical protein CIW52_01890 [Mycolicibacterium sp. P9-64]|uniref:hypothetical protein n=1 Tax=Mycolicibacterium sp. P9-64 TaxID=2024612 RepID=UPI0011EC5E64|nr:hypothetical protein [Mycolicibacterium sp. P9-64]KAA0086688.1 hypothetical protein CIW52_01890 [Mycolicibacterium sp. P9-64]